VEYDRPHVEHLALCSAGHARRELLAGLRHFLLALLDVADLGLGHDLLVLGEVLVEGGEHLIHVGVR